MLGWNHRLRNTPVRSSTTKLHRAISPSMNDQWSGKTLRRFFFIAVPSPRRSSAQMAAPPTRDGFLALAASVRLLRTKRPVSMLTRGLRSKRNGVSIRMGCSFGITLPEARAHRFGEIAPGHKIPLVVDHDGQLGERTGGRTEDHLAGVREIERRLVARAEQVVGGALVEGDRTAHVGADLGIGHDAGDRPVLPPGTGDDLVRLHPDHDHGGLRLGDLKLRALDDVLA